MFENLIRVSMNELNKMDANYAGKDEFADTDAKKFDLVAHGLSCLMKSLPYIEEFGFDQDHSISSRRGRDDMGRYTSMDRMGGGVSGHWPGQQVPLPPLYRDGYYNGMPPYWR